MPRYIDAELLPALFDEEYKGTLKLIEEEGATYLNNLAEGFLEADMVVSRVPTANVKEVVYAEWEERIVEDENPFFRRRFYCTACKGWQTHGKMDFCNMCGADMRSDKK